MKKSKLLFFILFICSLITAQNQLQNIEPPFWFAGMEYQDFQLMLHGKDIALYTPTLTYDGVKITGVDTTDNKNYLFINLKIEKTAKPGLLLFSFDKGKKSFKFSYELRAKNTNYKRLEINAKDVIYLITPDRFGKKPIEVMFVLDTAAILPVL